MNTKTKTKSWYLVPADTDENVHRVPQRRWDRWTRSARRMFNYVYGQGTRNKAIMADSFDETPENKNSISTASWNMAWQAASFHDLLIESR